MHIGVFVRVCLSSLLACENKEGEFHQFVFSLRTSLLSGSPICLSFTLGHQAGERHPEVKLC